MDADGREELIESIHRAMERAYLAPATREDAIFVADALLADFRFLLAHPDEVIRRDQLEQVGWINGAGSIVALDAALNGWEPVHRVRPAVEKEAP
jgi:hypothetical protein